MANLNNTTVDLNGEVPLSEQLATVVGNIAEQKTGTPCEAVVILIPKGGMGIEAHSTANPDMTIRVCDEYIKLLRTNKGHALFMPPKKKLFGRA